MSINDIILLVIAGYFATFALIVNTKDIKSALFFKVPTFFSAVVLTLISFKII